MNQRTAKVVALNDSLAVVLPKDWTRGMHVAKGDRVDLFYNGFIRIKAQKSVRLDAPPDLGVQP